MFAVTAGFSFLAGTVFGLVVASGLWALALREQKRVHDLAMIQLQDRVAELGRSL